MDLQISPFTIPFHFLFVVVLVYLLFSKKRNKHGNNLPPGPRQLPLIGNLHLFSGSEPFHRTLSKMAKKYGPLMHLQLGQIPTFVVTSSEVAEQILKTHDINFASRPSLIMMEIMNNGSKDIVWAPYGEYWRQLRKICTSELLSMKRVHSLRPIRESEFTNLCRWIASQSGSVINLTDKIILTNYGTITLAVLGKKSEEQAKFTSVIKDMAALASVFSIADVFPSFRFLRNIGGQTKKMEEMHRKSEDIILKIIDERRKYKDYKIVDDGDDRKQEDLLDVLLRIQDDDELQPPLTTQHIIPILQDVFVAGVETSATVIDWSMSELLKNPILLKKAQDEVRQVFDGKTHVNESYFDELKFLKLVIKETLRLHPPGALLLPRESRDQCKINGYDIPQKARVLVNTWAIQRDSRHWKDPDCFEPERFLDQNGDYNGNDFHFIPFGAGRRSCPGISFGLANVELPLAMLLYHFDWILPEGMKSEELDMEEALGVSARRKSHLNVIPVVSRPLPIE